MVSKFKLYHGDCLEILPTLEAGSVDAVITDPPYGIGKKNIVPGSRTDRNSKGRDDSMDCFNWDERREPERISIALDKAECAIVFGGNYYSDVLPISRGWIVWDKRNSGNFSDCGIAFFSVLLLFREALILPESSQAKTPMAFHPDLFYTVASLPL